MNSDAPSSRVEALIGKMSLEQKVGQALTLCFNGSAMHPLVYRQIEDFHCAGLRVTQSSMCEARHGFRYPAPFVTPSQYAEVLNHLQEVALKRPLGIPLHFSTDQEGDTSSNYCMGGVRFFPSQTGLVACGDPEYARRAGLAVARQIRAAGMHWVHSPVLDVNSNWANPEIGERAFSDDAEVCATYGRALLEGLKEGGIIATGKHFPGRGDSDKDAHHAITSLNIPRNVMVARDVLPYSRNLDVLPAIMLAHSAFPALDPSGLPATVSKAIATDFLRGEVGFQGVVTTDNMEMQGITKLYPIPEGCWRALAAGADLVLMKAEDATCEAVFNGILAAVKSGELPLERLEEANRRVLTMKLRYGLFERPLADPVAAEAAVHDEFVVQAARDCVRAGLQVVRDPKGLMPIRPDARILVVEQRIDAMSDMQCEDLYTHDGMLGEMMLRHTRRFDHHLVKWVPDGEDRARVAERMRGPYDVAVVTHWNRRSTRRNDELIDVVRATGTPVISVANSPYPHACDSHADAVLLCFQIRGDGALAMAEALFGNLKTPGCWPLSKKRQPVNTR